MNRRVVKLEYQPNPKQQQAHTLSAKFRGFCGGWGNGKTTWGCSEFFVRLLEYPGCRSIISRKTRPELKATTWDMFLNGEADEGAWHGVPKECIKQYNKSDLYLELFNGSTVYGLPLDDPKKLENFNLGLFWIDQAEEVEQDIFLKFHGRLRQHHSPREGLLSFNPNGHNWLWKYFIDPKRKDDYKRLYKCIEASPFDNPKLPADYFEAFANLPTHWYQRFVEGSHEVFVGQIFTDWHDEIHVVQPFRIPSKWERWQCTDPGIRHEGCISWCAQSPNGDVFYYREHLESNQPVDWWAATIFELEGDNDVGGPDEEIFRRLIGPEANQRSQTDGKSVIDLFHENGIYPEFADKDPSARISRITEYLRPKPGHLHPFGAVAEDADERDGAPRLYVFSSCTKLLEYLPQYRWRPQRTNFTEEDPPEKVRKKDDHNVDCLGHILLAMDDLPDVEDSTEIPSAEQQFLDEHFRIEVEAAAERTTLRSYRSGRIPTTVG